MSQHLLPEPTTRRRRSAFAILRKLGLAVGIGVGVAGGVAPAAEPAPPTAISDVRLARSALTAIDRDPELRTATLVVSVVDRVAVIGGPVTSAKQAQRAEQVVRGIAGIADVRNTCFVAQGPDPLLRSMSERLGSSLPPRPVFLELPGVVSNQLTTGAPALPTVTPLPEANAVAGTPPETRVALKPTAEAGILGAPVGPGTAKSVSGSSPLPATAPGLLTGTNAPAPANPASVLKVANDLKQTEARFAKLIVELREGTLVVTGAAPLVADAWDFAKKLQTTPGVTRVAVGAVTGK